MKKNSYLFVIQLISLMMVFTYNIVLARNLGPAEYGDFSTAFSFVSIAYVICLLGADITAFKFIAIAYDKKNIGEVKAFIKFVVVTTVGISCLFYLICFSTYFIVIYYTSIKTVHPVFLAIVFIPFMSLCFFFYKVLISLSQPILSNFIYKLMLNGMVFLLLMISTSELMQLTAKIAIFMVLVPWIVVLIILLYLVIKTTQLLYVETQIIKPKSWIVAGVSSMPFSLSLMAIANLGIIAAEFFLHDEQMVGAFASASWIAQLFNSIFVSLAFTVSLSQASVYVENNQSAGLYALLKKHLITTSIFSLLFLITVILFGKEILSLYGEYYTSAYSVLIWLAIMQSLIVICCIAIPILNYMKRYLLTIIFSVAVIVLILPLAYFLNIYYSEDGIAVALLIAVLIGFLTPQIYLFLDMRKKALAEIIKGTSNNS